MLQMASEQQKNDIEKEKKTKKNTKKNEKNTPEKEKKKVGRPKGSKNKPKEASDSKGSKATGTKKKETKKNSKQASASRNNKRNKSDTEIKTDIMVRRFTTSLLLDENLGIEERVNKLFKKWGKSLKIGGSIIHDKDIYTDDDEFNHKMEVQKQINILRERLERKEITPAEYDSRKARLEESVSDIVAGKAKKVHIHIYMDFGRNAHSLADICKYLSDEENGIIVPENMIQFVTAKKGQLHKNILGALAYLTHQTTASMDAGKYQYDNNAVKNFKFDPTNKADYSQIIHDIGEIKTYDDFIYIYEKFRREFDVQGMNYITEILKGNLHPNEVAQIDEAYYFSGGNERKLLNARKHYVNEILPAPTLRFTFYIGPAHGIHDAGRIGKSMTGKALALNQCALMNPVLYKKLYEQVPNDLELFKALQANKMIFVVGAKGVSFDGYDGEPIIMFDDCRPNNLIKMFGSRDALLTYFDPPFTRQAMNVKFGSVVLKNMVTIINGYNNYDDFVQELSRTVVRKDDGDGIRSYYQSESTSQIKGRIPFIYHISPSSIRSDIQLQYMIGTNAHDISTRYPNLLRDASQNRQLRNAGEQLLSGFTERKPMIENHYSTKRPDELRDVMSDFNAIDDPDYIKYLDLHDMGYSKYTPAEWGRLLEYMRHADANGAQGYPKAGWEDCFDRFLFEDEFSDAKDMYIYFFNMYLRLYSAEYDLPRALTLDIDLIHPSKKTKPFMRFVRAEFELYLELAKRYN